MDTFQKLILLLAFAGPSLSEPIVEIEGGKLLGLDHGHYLSFESIPYAEPPLGVNRFEPPKPYTATWSDVRNATYPPPKCIQWGHLLPREDKLEGVEDCLTINVYTPSIGDNRKYPVLVLIHGGAFTFGAPACHDHVYVMEQRAVVVVKMNYRLGPLGFLSTEDELIPGNFGLKDQLLALEWVKTNIAAFNGNPSNITLIGFSSGAASVHLHMMNKRLEKLADSAISFSGTALNPAVVTRNARRKAVILAKYLDCPNDNSTIIKFCLQQKDAAAIVRAVRHFFKFGFNPFTVFGPVVEPNTVADPFLTEEPEVTIKKGKSAEIPWLASYSKDEGAFDAADLLKKNVNGSELIEVLNDRWTELAPIIFFYENTLDTDEFDSYSKDLRQKYMGNQRFSVENYRLVQKMFTDVLFLQGIEKALKLHKEYTNSPVYSYEYDNPAPTGFGQVLSHRKDIEFGTAHGDDFFLMFKGRPRKDIPFTDSEELISKNFIKMMVDFCATGNLQFGTCKLVENNQSTKDLWVTQITKDGCENANIETIL